MTHRWKCLRVPVRDPSILSGSHSRVPTEETRAPEPQSARSRELRPPPPPDGPTLTVNLYVPSRGCAVPPPRSLPPSSWSRTDPTRRPDIRDPSGFTSDVTTRRRTGSARGGPTRHVTHRSEHALPVSVGHRPTYHGGFYDLGLGTLDSAHGRYPSFPKRLHERHSENSTLRTGPNEPTQDLH